MTTLITTGDPYRISNSEIQTFKDCRRKWWLNYYRRLQPKGKKYTGPLALGTRLHAALDEYYSNGTPLLDAHKALLDADRVKAATEFAYTDELDNEGELGRTMLEGYLEWVDEEGIDADYDLVSTEESMEMPMFDGSVILQGKLDMRVKRKSDGMRFFKDFKTTASFENFTKIAHLNEQILTYMTLEAAKVDEPHRTGGGIFLLLKKNKRSARANPPFFQQLEVRHNAFTLRSFWKRLHGEVTDIMRVKTALDAGTSHLEVAYPTPSNDCTWKCPFFAICPMFDDGSAVEAAISDAYEVSDPNARYSDDKKGSE